MLNPARAFSVASRIFGGAAAVWSPQRGQPLAGGEEQPPARLYELLWSYYVQNHLYDDVTLALAVQGTTREALKGLRNPANRVVEFHVSKIWPGTLPDALPLVWADGGRAPALQAATERVWRWSNWASQKQVFVRKAAALGDAFVRVSTTTAPDGGELPPEQRRVYWQLIEPAHVTDFAADERGYLTRIRVDVPQEERDAATGRARAVTHTEVWEKAPAGSPEALSGEAGRVRKWRHTQGDESDLGRLGDPYFDRPLSFFGIDFLPFVHCQFRDLGEARGAGAFTHAIDKIDEANRAATRLHQLLYRSNDEFWALEGEGRIGADGRELPPPRIRGLAGSSTGDDGTGTVQVGGSRIAAIPGGWRLTPKIPALNYGAWLDALRDQLLELERDLPELAYSRLTEEGSNLSGRAVRFLLAGAVDRAIEARGNCEAALIRLQEMALTIGQVQGIPGFSVAEIGTYAAGTFAHDVAKRDVLPSDTLEDAQAALAEMQALTAKSALVNTAPPIILREMGYSLEEIGAILAMRAAAAPAPTPIAQTGPPNQNGAGGQQPPPSSPPTVDMNAGAGMAAMMDTPALRALLEAVPVGATGQGA